MLRPRSMTPMCVVQSGAAGALLRLPRRRPPSPPPPPCPLPPRRPPGGPPPPPPPPPRPGAPPRRRARRPSWSRPPPAGPLPLRADGRRAPAPRPALAEVGGDGLRVGFRRELPPRRFDDRRIAQVREAVAKGPPARFGANVQAARRLPPDGVRGEVVEDVEDLERGNPARRARGQGEIEVAVTSGEWRARAHLVPAEGVLSPEARR